MRERESISPLLSHPHFLHTVELSQTVGVLLNAFSSCLCVSVVQEPLSVLSSLSSTTLPLPPTFATSSTAFRMSVCYKKTHFKRFIRKRKRGRKRKRKKGEMWGEKVKQVSWGKFCSAAVAASSRTARLRRYIGTSKNIGRNLQREKNTS